MTIQLFFEDQSQEMDVKPDMELEDFQNSIKIRLSLSDMSQLEQYDEHFGKWMTVGETEDLELKDGAKFKVQKLTREVITSIGL